MSVEISIRSLLFIKLSCERKLMSGLSCEKKLRDFEKKSAKKKNYFNYIMSIFSGLDLYNSEAK